MVLGVPTNASQGSTLYAQARRRHLNDPIRPCFRQPGGVNERLVRVRRGSPSSMPEVGSRVVLN